MGPGPVGPLGFLKSEPLTLRDYPCQTPCILLSLSKVRAVINTYLVHEGCVSGLNEVGFRSCNHVIWILLNLKERNIWIHRTLKKEWVNGSLVWMKLVLDLCIVWLKCYWSLKKKEKRKNVFSIIMRSWWDLKSLTNVWRISTMKLTSPGCLVFDLLKHWQHRLPVLGHRSSGFHPDHEKVSGMAKKWQNHVVHATH